HTHTHTPTHTHTHTHIHTRTHARTHATHLGECGFKANTLFCGVAHAHAQTHTHTHPHTHAHARTHTCTKSGEFWVQRVQSLLCHRTGTHSYRKDKARTLTHKTHTNELCSERDVPGMCYTHTHTHTHTHTYIRAEMCVFKS